MATSFTIERIQAQPNNLFRTKERYRARTVEDMGVVLVEVYNVDNPSMTLFRGTIEMFNTVFEDSGIA